MHQEQTNTSGSGFQRHEIVGGAAAEARTISVLVPTYNERENIPELSGRIFAVADEQEWDLELVIIDDQSPDGTAEVAREESTKHGGRIRTIERIGPRGLAVSVIDGIRATSSDVMVVMDADLQHPAEALPSLVGPLIRGQSRFVLGSRYVPGGEIRNWSFARLLNSKVATLLARPLTRARDPMTGFFAFSREALGNQQNLDPTGYKICLELLVKGQVKEATEVPITFSNRLHGTTKLSVAEQLCYLHHLVRLYSYAFPTVTQLARYAIVGATGVFVDLAALTLWVSAFAMPFSAARILSFATALTWNFLLNRRWTFGVRSGNLNSQFLKYACGVVPAGAVNWLLSVLAYDAAEFFRTYYQLAACVGTVAAFFLGFLVAKYFAFATPTRPKADSV